MHAATSAEHNHRLRIAQAYLWGERSMLNVATPAGNVTRRVTRRIIVARIAPHAFAAFLGAGVGLAGFAPFSNANTALGLSERPWAVAGMPAVLVALAALLTAVLRPAPQPPALPRSLVAGAALLLAGGCVSVLGSDAPQDSATLVVLAISAPMLLFVGLIHARLDSRWIAVGFLAAVTVMLLRADAVFFRDWGLPSVADLEAAKYQNVAYDFHYYTLGNPDHTAGFLLMPFTLAAFWAAGETRLRGWCRGLLVCAAGLVGVTLVLTFARFAIASAVAVLVVLALAVPAGRRIRAALLATVLTVAAGLLVVSVDYVAQLLNADRNASVPERVGSLKDGLITLADHPFTGVGLGRYSTDSGYFPAHSSIVQAGTEMGVLGLCGLVVLTLAVCAHAARMIRRHGWLGLPSAAALAVAVYAVHAALAASSSSGLFSGYISEWGLSAALLLALSFKPPPAVA
jgi:O-antigen ligase